MSRNIPPVLQRAIQSGPLLLTLLALALIGAELARAFWLFMPDGPSWEPPTPAAVSASAKNSAPALNITPLLTANLYGTYEANAAPVENLNPVDAPDTKLRLTLRGIVASENPDDSRALIESNPSDLVPYVIGMDVPGGAKLHAIYPDRVLLKRAGRLETLRLEKDLPTDPEAVVAMPAISNRPSGAQILGAEAAMKLSNIRTELLNDPTKASRYMRMQPARRDGSLVGYRIYPGRDRQLFREIGLRPGDILTRVNGVDLNDPSRSLQLLGELSQASNVDITIERAGNQQSFSVSLNP